MAESYPQSLVIYTLSKITATASQRKMVPNPPVVTQSGVPSALTNYLLRECDWLLKGATNH